MNVIYSFQYFANFSTDPGSPEIKFFRTGLTYAFILTEKLKYQQNIHFFDDFYSPENSFFLIITVYGQELIVLNTFLDSLCHFGFKNLGLIPGIPKRCFQHP